MIGFRRCGVGAFRRLCGGGGEAPQSLGAVNARAGFEQADAHSGFGQALGQQGASNACSDDRYIDVDLVHLAAGGCSQSGAQTLGGRANHAVRQISPSCRVATTGPSVCGRMPEYQAAMISTSTAPQSAHSSSAPFALGRASRVLSADWRPTSLVSDRSRQSAAAKPLSKADAGKPVSLADSSRNASSTPACGEDAAIAAMLGAAPQNVANVRRFSTAFAPSACLALVAGEGVDV